MIHYHDRWAVVTGASSGLGRGLAARLADRGMSVVFTGRDETRLDEATNEIRRAAPQVKVETVVADLATGSGVSALLDHVGDRPVEVLVNDAGFGSYGVFAEADGDREDDEVAVDVGAVVTLARAFLPGMLARGSGGHAQRRLHHRLPTRAVRRRCTERARHSSCRSARLCGPRPARPAWRSPRLCPGPTRTGFVDALGADVADTKIDGQLAEPEPVIEAGLRALDKGRSVVIPGLKNWIGAAGGRFTPRQWLTLFSGWLLRQDSTTRPPIEDESRAATSAAAG